jgi:HEAT repeat protein
MVILPLLASSLDRRDETPNVELAARVSNDEDQKAIKELISLLDHKNKNIRHDVIKVLYEIGALKPALIAGFMNSFRELLSSKDNRMQWGAMTALHAIAPIKPKEMRELLPALSDVAEKGSVITRDQFVSILVKLMLADKKNEDLFALIIEQLKNCPPNQLPMYAEMALPIVPSAEKESFKETLNNRMNDLEKASKKLRIEKVLKKLEK